MSYLTVKNFDISNQITDIDSLENREEIKRNEEKEINLTTKNNNDSCQNMTDVIKKEIVEAAPSFGDHYLSSFVSGSGSQIKTEELDIKMDSFDSSDPLLDNDDSNDDGKVCFVS